MLKKEAQVKKFLAKSRQVEVLSAQGNQTGSRQGEFVA
jgi:hypothetical protein